MDIQKSILFELQARRQKLDMPYQVLAQKCHLGMSTVQRVLHGQTVARLDTIITIADALGFSLDLKPEANVNEIRMRQAREKARQLVSLSQGTAALEAQGVNDDAVKNMEEKFIHQFLAGSDRRLWG